MSEARLVNLEDRGVLAVAGEDRVAFLQGLVSNDVERVTPAQAVYAAFLTPQGKFLFDFIIVDDGERLLLDCEAARLADFAKRLRIYKLRSKAVLSDVSESFRVFAVHGDGALATLGLNGGAAPGASVPCLGGLAITDPRLAALGARLLLPVDVDPSSLGLAPGRLEDYHRRRIQLGVPDGSRDMEVDKTVLLEAGFDELNGVDWKKGCYMGQELTARTKYRGLVKRRLMPITTDGPLPLPGTRITLDGRDAGEIRSTQGDVAMAMVRLNMLEQTAEGAAVLTAGEVTVTPQKPDWAAF
ncbi:MAG: folate-binding protein [Proteobacteria bacterium]|nr:folate-binding protein [Pseudomonadota bacterium]MDA1310308.1 folate-binding protein [Pseudomonadota bacterium]